MKDDLVYIEHIQSSLNKISKYIEDHSIESFLKSNITQDAIIRQLEVIGEAAKKLTKEFIEENKGIPWSDMAKMRDKLIHDYFEVDIWIVWKTAISDVPELQIKISQIAIDQSE